MTADAVSTAQSEHATEPSPLTVTHDANLQEQDFGFYEGKPFYARQRDSPNKTGRESHYEAHRNDPDFVDVESKDSLARRADAFIDVHLLPLFEDAKHSDDHCIVVVSHGILLSHLWRRFLLRLPRRSLTVTSEVSTARSPLVLEHLGGWSNTGFLELDFVSVSENGGSTSIEEPPSKATAEITETAAGGPSTPTSPPEALPVSQDVQFRGADDVHLAPSTSSRRITDFATTILAVDGKPHLQGLKRTRGGIGRAQYDEKQKTMDSFFKRAKKE